MFLRRIGTLCGAVLLATLLMAQSERGTISGAVTDATGALVIGAKITVTNVATGVAVSLTSNASGEFVAPSLPTGTYTLRVEKEGFRSAILSGIELNAAQNIRADTKLEVGTATASVEVRAGAVQLATDNAKSSFTVIGKQVDEMATVVGGTLRSPLDLASGAPEAKPLGGDNGFMLAGGQAASYGTNLDGVSANTTRALSQSWVAVNAPSLEAISEFTVDTNGFKAEYGHAGGGVINFASKSGTNEFHGTVYEFLRNTALDANNWFNNRAGLPIPVYKQHDFGASFGGPVWIPKLYKG